MVMPNRKFSGTSEYRYGFNGKENDKDAGEGVQDYGMRIYDSRLGRFLSVDPLSRKYPWNSTYAFAENDVVRCIDLEGLEKLEVFLLIGKSASGTVLTKGQTAIQISYDIKKNTISLMYGKVGAETRELNYDIGKRQLLNMTIGSISAAEVADKYGQVGTMISKGQLSKITDITQSILNIDIPFTQTDKVKTPVDVIFYNELKKHDLQDLFISVTDLLGGVKKVLNNKEIQFQMVKTDEGTATRLFDNDGIDIDKNLHVNLALVQYINPKNPETKSEPKPSAIDKLIDAIEKNGNKNMKTAKDRTEHVEFKSKSKDK